MLRLLVSSIFVLLCVVVAFAEQQKIRVAAPGATGVVTNVGFGQHKLTDAYYLLNVETTRQPGILMKRSGLFQFGLSSKPMSAAHALFDAPSGWKCAVGIRRGDSIDVGPFALFDAADVDSQINLASSDSILGIPIRSDSFGTVVTTDFSGGWLLNYRPNDQNFVHTDDYLVYVDGHVPPMTFSAVDLLTATSGDSGAGITRDTIGFSPNIKSLALEPPGVLRPFPLNNVTGGNVTTTVQYATAFYDHTQGITAGSDSVGPLSLPSIEVPVTSGYVALTAFPVFPYAYADRDDSVSVKIFRRTLGGAVDNQWKVLDSITYAPNKEIVYIDNNAVGSLTDIWPDSLNDDHDDSIPAPGANWVWSYGATTIDTNKSWTPDTLYWFKASYYDPVRDIESPLGPAFSIVSPDGVGAVTEPGVMSWPTYGYHQHAKYMRIYQTVTRPGLLGSGDTLVWYLYAEVDLDTLDRVKPDAWFYNEIYVGLLNDSFVVDPAPGIDFLPFLIYRGPRGLPRIRLESSVYGESGFYFLPDKKQKPPSAILTPEGGATIQPPFIGQLQGTFTDIAFANGRLWGVGDAQFPSRVYYSEYEDFGNWPDNFLQLGAGDGEAITAIERIPTGDADVLLPFKPTSIYVITGYDPEFDLTLNILSDDVGTSESDLVVRDGSDIYFVSTDLKIYRMRGLSEPQDISASARMLILSVLADTSSSDPPRPTDYIGRNGSIIQLGRQSNLSVKGELFGDYVLWINQIDGRTLAWNTVSGVWSLNKYNLLDEPRGVLLYDTAHGVRLSPYATPMFYFDGRAYNLQYMVDSTDANNSYFVFRSPFYGDGVHLFSIDHIDITLFGRDSFFVRIINSAGDTLSTDTLAETSQAKGLLHYRLGIGNNLGKYLSFEIRDNKNSGGGGVRTALYDYTVYLKNMGFPHDD